MAAYDPKRPRPSASTPSDDPAPVEALLDPGPTPVDAPPVDTAPVDTSPITEPAAATEAAAVASAQPVESQPIDESPTVEAASEPAVTDDHGESSPDTVPGVRLNGSASTTPPAASPTPSEVPVAPAPETGTANRAVVIAGVVSSLVALLVVVLLLRRRRNG